MVKTPSTANTAAAVMRMVIKYERSIREARLEEIKGWRKALALGAAGLAGLSPMKAKAAEPVPPTPYTQSVAQTPGEQAPLTSSQATDAMNFLQDLRGATHVQSVDYDDKTDSYTWKGPTTGKQMSMSRTEFNNEIWAPYQGYRRDELAPGQTRSLARKERWLRG